MSCHALTKSSGSRYMQLGDTYAILVYLHNSIRWCASGLEIRKSVLGVKDPRVGETCRYLAEAHVQAMQFDEAESLCRMALDIHGKMVLQVLLKKREIGGSWVLFSILCLTMNSQ